MPSATPDQAALRARQLGAIHATQKGLGLSADDARALKLSVVGVASSADMTAQQRQAYLAHLYRLQGVAPARPPRQRSVDDRGDERWRKARALWHALAKAGHVRVDTDAALMAYVGRQTGMDHWRFLNGYQINLVVESLKRWAARPAPQETQA